MNAFIAVISTEIFSNSVKKSFLLLFSAWLLMSIFTTGGRILVYILLVDVCIAFMIFKNQVIFSKKNKYYFIIMSLISFIFMYYMSIYRKDNVDYDFLHSIYIYFCGCIPHMSYRLETLDMTIDYTYGVTFLSGFMRPFMLAFKYISNSSFPEIYQETIDIGINLSSSIYISDGVTYNAFASLFYYFYYDLGYFSVFFNSLLYGICCWFFYSKVKNTINKYNVAFYLLIIQGIFTSMIRWPFVIVSYVLAFFVLPIIYNKLIIRKNNSF